MKVEIRVPEAGESVTEAVVAALFKESGSAVEKEEELFELETDKVNQVVYAPEAGTLHLTIQVEERVTPNQVVGFVETEGAAQEAAPPLPHPSPQKAPEGDGVRRFAPEIPSAPKENEAAPPPKPKGGERRERMSGLRRTIAKRLVEVKNSTAMLTTFNEVDMSAIIALRTAEKERFLEQHGVKLGFMSFFVKACTYALKELPAVNAYIEGEEIVYNSSCHVGISVSTPKGLMVPVLKEAHTLSFAAIERGIQHFAEKARDASISISDLQGGTFTITNGGIFGSLLSTPILNPPQSAILGMHNIVRRPIAEGEQVVIRPMMYLALSYDHRIIDGKEGVTFLVRVKELLEKPERLLLGERDE